VKKFLAFPFRVLEVAAAIMVAIFLAPGFVALAIALAPVLALAVAIVLFRLVGDAIEGE